MNGAYYYYYMDPTYSGPLQLWTNTQFVDYAKGIRKTQYKDNYNTPLLDELTISFEKALGEDLALNLTGFYKKRHNLARSIGIMPDGTFETADNWYLYKAAFPVGDTTVPLYARHVKPVGTYYLNYEKGL